jgi:hypothetical protein
MEGRRSRPGSVPFDAREKPSPVEAATDELGFVMVRRAFVDDELHAGRLIAPLARRARTSGLIRALEGWILQQTAQMEAAEPEAGSPDPLARPKPGEQP